MAQNQGRSAQPHEHRSPIARRARVALWISALTTFGGVVFNVMLFSYASTTCGVWFW